MRISTEIPFAHASRRLVSSLQPWPQQRGDVRAKQNPNPRFSTPHFDADSERLFWQERQAETLSTMKTALSLGAACIPAFIALDVFNNGGLSKNEAIICVLMTLAVGILWLSLHRHFQDKNQVNAVAKLSAVLSVANLIVILFVEGNTAFYAQIWVGLLPVYFLVYGQMFT